MSSILSSVFGGTNISTTLYIDSNINLTKSIVIKINKEADLYNEYLYDTYGIVSDSVKNNWRYYLHLSGSYYMKGKIDQPVYVTSLDNSELIEVTKETLNLHLATKQELLKYSNFYNELIDKYPYQELYIKACLNNTQLSIQEIIDLPDYTIVSYNDEFIEIQETSLIEELQNRIYKYSVTWLLDYYQLVDSLFLATQIAILYQFIYTSILTIRLNNIKTSQTHTYHIKQYLASHHSLDRYIDYLTDAQIRFLYKNLLFLLNHSGTNIVFNELVEKLFSDRNITIVNYKYHQINNVVDAKMKYNLKQIRLNKKNLLFFNTDITLESLSNKEMVTASNNKKYYETEVNSIDFKLSNTLFNTILTKDLETILVDQSDNVRWKLVETILGELGWCVKNKEADFQIKVSNPITGEALILSIMDLLKLYQLLDYYKDGILLPNFQKYIFYHTLRDIIPTHATLINKYVYKNKLWCENELSMLMTNIPIRREINSVSKFEERVSSVYKYNTGLWLYLSNLSDIDNQAQFEKMCSTFYTTDSVDLNNETVTTFISRLNITGIETFSRDKLELIQWNLLDSAYNKKLSRYFNSEKIQKVMSEIFGYFKSYSTQIVNNYNLSKFLIPRFSDTRLGIKSTDIDTSSQLMLETNMTDVKSLLLKNVYYENTNELSHSVDISTSLKFDRSNNISIRHKHKSNNIMTFLFNTTFSLPTDNSWVKRESSDEDLLFLAFNKVQG